MRLFLALTAGALGAALVWGLASRALDRQLAEGLDAVGGRITGGEAELQRRLMAGRAQLQNELKREITLTVPPLVEREMIRTLAGYGITPQTGRRLSIALAGAERLGLLGGG